MQENKELYFGYFKHISQNIIFNDYVNLLPLNSYGYNSKKIFFCKRNSTLPPLVYYISNNQYVRRGGIMGGIWVELYVIPPIFHP